MKILLWLGYWVKSRYTAGRYPWYFCARSFNNHIYMIRPLSPYNRILRLSVKIYLLNWKCTVSNCYNCKVFAHWVEEKTRKGNYIQITNYIKRPSKSGGRVLRALPKSIFNQVNWKDYHVLIFCKLDCKYLHLVLIESAHRLFLSLFLLQFVVFVGLAFACTSMTSSWIS